MDNVRLHDDIFSEEEIQKIYDAFVDECFPWYFNDDNSTVSGNATEVDGDEYTKEYIQFVHLFNLKDGTPNSSYVDLSDHILNTFLSKTKIKLHKLLKVKANFQPQDKDFDEIYYNTPHVDDMPPHWVLLYYINDSDGDTRVWTREIGHPKTEYQLLQKVTPKAGRFCLFNGKHYHCGAHPKLNDKRLVLNYNLYLEL
jgi:hypothetical protein